MTVTWLPPALDRLADYYVALPLAEQRRVESLIERIERRLVENTGLLGESRNPLHRRVWFVGPFVLTFEIVPGGEIRILYLMVLRYPADEP